MTNQLKKKENFDPDSWEVLLGKLTEMDWLITSKRSIFVQAMSGCCRASDPQHTTKSRKKFTLAQEMHSSVCLVEPHQGLFPVKYTLLGSLPCCQCGSFFTWNRHRFLLYPPFLNFQWRCNTFTTFIGNGLLLWNRFLRGSSWCFGCRLCMRQYGSVTAYIWCIFSAWWLFWQCGCCRSYSSLCMSFLRS